MLGIIREISENFYHLNAGIRGLSLLLIHLGFPTNNLNDPHTDNYPLPWIEIREMAPDNWQENQEQQAAWKNKNRNNKQKMLRLLGVFYENRLVPKDQMLMVKNIGSFEGFILCNSGLNVLDPQAHPELTTKKHGYLAEFTEFYKFLQETSNT